MYMCYTGIMEVGISRPRTAFRYRNTGHERTGIKMAMTHGEIAQALINEYWRIANNYNAAEDFTVALSIIRKHMKDGTAFTVKPDGDGWKIEVL